jgi:hypothetical protein
MTLLRVAAASAFLLGCSTAIVTDDVLPDSGGKDGAMPIDSGMKDSGKDSGMDSSMMDSSMDDASMDALDEDGGPGFDAQPLDGGIASLSGLVLWLDAAKGVTKNNQNQVSKWADQSSSANDGSQSTQSMQPVWNGSVINGFPALHFDKANTQSLSLVDSSSLQWGTGDFLIEVVVRWDNDGSNGEFGLPYGKIGQSSGVVFIAGDAQNDDNGLSAAIDGQNLIAYTAGYNDNKARLVAFRRSGSTLELRVNGSQVASQAQSGTVDVSASGVDAVIGDDGMGDIPLDGDIAEVVGVKGATSSQDLSSLEAFLKAKYNL